MPSRLLELAKLAKKRVDKGYYDGGAKVRRRHASLSQAIASCDHTPIIAEIKYGSPSQGKIRDNRKTLEIARDMLAGGACGISVLTDPDSFSGGLHILAEIANRVAAPLVMKDIIVSPKQVKAAATCGADAIVLISEIFTGALADVQIRTILREAKHVGLETLIEAHTSAEFEKIRTFTPDLYGINNRNLSTFEVDLDTTRKILGKAAPLDRPVVSESGIQTAADIRHLKNEGVHAFLVGTSIMKSASVEEKVKELVNA